MKPRIAIPEPCSYDVDYSTRALPPYLRAVESCGGETVVLSLDMAPEDIARQAASCSAVLLPGSKADIDPQKYNAEKHPQTAPADSPRDAVDELLLQDAYAQRKPILGICYGLQALNVWRSGTLVQHIESKINHSTRREIEIAHQARIERGSRLAAVFGLQEERAIPVNSSHHQAAMQLGDGLRVSARCPDDGIIEAIEGTNPDHYVLAVQWHPERGFERDHLALRIFASLFAAASRWMTEHRPG